MTLSKTEAMAQVDLKINEMDLDWPTKPKHVIFGELTQETEQGWVFYYGIPEEMRVIGRDPEPRDNPPWQVNRETGELTLLDESLS